jgi:hypothetical protein
MGKLAHEVPRYPLQERGALCSVAQIIEAQLEYARSATGAHGGLQLPYSLLGRRSGNHGTYTIRSKN